MRSPALLTVAGVLLLGAACSLPAALGGQAPAVAPTAIAFDGPPASAQIAGVVPSATPLFDQTGGRAAAAAPTATGAAPALPLAAQPPLAPEASAASPSASFPPAPTLVPQAAAAATANAATAVAQVSRANATATALPTQQVAVQNFTFSPATLTVQPGTTVIWRNLDAATHHITGSDFDSGQVLSGEYWGTLFQRPGKFDYACSIHPTMHGQVIVSPPNAAERFSS